MKFRTFVLVGAGLAAAAFAGLSMLGKSTKEEEAKKISSEENETKTKTETDHTEVE